ncbi:MAG: cupredoxin domain-containing protein [Anaerolineales bacterium]
MKFKRTLPYILLGVIFVTVLSACGSSSSTVDVALKTYDIVPSTSSVSAGEVTFQVHNDATDLTHEFVVFKTDLPEGDLPLTDEGIVDEEADGITLIDEVEDVEPGMSAELTVTLEPGNYVLVCNIDSDEMHYQHGMHAVFIVK